MYYSCYLISTPIVFVSNHWGKLTNRHHLTKEIPPANPCTPKSSPFPFLVSSQFTSLRSCCLHLGFLVPQLFAPWQLKFPKLLGFPEVSWGFLRFPGFGSPFFLMALKYGRWLLFWIWLHGRFIQIFVNWWFRSFGEDDILIIVIIFQLWATGSHLWLIFHDEIQVLPRTTIWWQSSSIHKQSFTWGCLPEINGEWVCHNWVHHVWVFEMKSLNLDMPQEMQPLEEELQGRGTVGFEVMLGHDMTNQKVSECRVWVRCSRLVGHLRTKHWHHMGVSKNRGTRKWMVYNGNPY